MAERFLKQYEILFTNAGVYNYVMKWICTSPPHDGYVTITT